MDVIAPGRPAPSIEGVPFGKGPTAVVFYKVTCPTCQLAAPAVGRVARAYPGHVVGVGQDPPDRLEAFVRRFDASLPTTPDLPPYPLSRAYGIRVVPTVVLVDGEGTVRRVVESWDRDGLNTLSAELAELAGLDAAAFSSEGDGLPPFRPG